MVQTWRRRGCRWLAGSLAFCLGWHGQSTRSRFLSPPFLYHFLFIFLQTWPPPGLMAVRSLCLLCRYFGYFTASFLILGLAIFAASFDGLRAEPAACCLEGCVDDQGHIE